MKRLLSDLTSRNTSYDHNLRLNYVKTIKNKHNKKKRKLVEFDFRNSITQIFMSEVSMKLYSLKNFYRHCKLKMVSMYPYNSIYKKTSQIFDVKIVNLTCKVNNNKLETKSKIILRSSTLLHRLLKLTYRNMNGITTTNKSMRSPLKPGWRNRTFIKVNFFLKVDNDS